MSIKHQLPKANELKPRITVIGVGGAGGNAINNMIASGIDGVEFIAANTDAQALISSSAERRIQLGADLTEGLGAGARPEIGQAAAQEAIADIQEAIVGSHMVFIAAGMGGGTGTGAASVVAKAARDSGILTVAIVTKPFNFEGNKRMRVAEAGIEELRQNVDTLIVIPNQNLFRIANERTTFAEAFLLADQVLHSGIACITDLIVREGLINLDFADVRAVMAGMGTAMMGTGEAAGERRAAEAAELAILNPLLDDISLRGARGLLISISGSRSLTLYEVDEAATRVRNEVDPDANVIIGATFDETLGDRIRVSIVASGLQSEPAALQSRAAKSAPRPVSPAAAPPPQRGPAVSIPEPTPQLDQAPPAANWQQPHSHGQSRTGDAVAEQIRPTPEEVWALENSYAASGAAIASDGPTSPVPQAWSSANDVVIELSSPFGPQTRADHAPAWKDERHDFDQHPAPAPQFRPQPPADGRRPQRRLPDVGDFAPFAQNAYRAKRGETGQPAEAPRPAADNNKRSGLFSFLTGRRDTAKTQGDSAANARPAPRQRPEADPSDWSDTATNNDQNAPKRLPMPRHRPRQG